MLQKRYTISLLFLLFLLVQACKNKPKQETTESKIETKTPLLQNASKDTTLWIEHFRIFRDAVYQGKKDIAKEYIKFPINNEIDSYTEANYEKDFNRIFPKKFIQTILKIKSQKLFETGSVKTPFILEQEKEERYKAYANYYKKDSTLQINIYIETEFEIGEGKDKTTERGESSLIYTFKISPENKPILTWIMMAG